MLAQLQALEQTVLAMKKQYAVTATELANLKQKVANDTSPRIISQLQTRLESAEKETAEFKQQISELEGSRQALQKQVEDLYQANQALAQQNEELKSKNALAISRAEIIRNWLAQIDSQN